MSELSKRVFAAYSGVFLIFLLFQNSLAQTPDKDILDREINPTIKTGTVYQIFAGLDPLGELSKGFEGAADFDFGKGKIIQVEKGTLREILDSIVKQEPDYTWELRDGVINVYPVKSRDELLKILLETTIKNFSSGKEKGRVQIAENIRNSEEIKKFLDSGQIRLGGFTRANLHAADATTDIDLSNTDLRSLLNKVVKDSGDSKLWTLMRIKEDGGILLAF